MEIKGYYILIYAFCFVSFINVLMFMIDYVKLAKEKAENKNKVDENLEFVQYIAACYTNCSSQSYGAKIEKRIKKDYYFKKIPHKKGEGDFLVPTTINFNSFTFSPGDKIEFKVSYLSYDKSWNLLQIRPYEKFNYYIFLLIDPHENCDYEWFILNKKDVEELKMGSCHGTKESNLSNLNIEHKISLKKNDNTYTKLKELKLNKDV